MPSQAAIKRAWEPRCTPPWVRFRLYGGAVVTVDALLVEAMRAMNAIAEAYDYPCSGPDNGAYNCRKVKGTNSWSKHAYAIAVDRRWKTNPYRRPLTTDRPAAMNRALVSVRTNNGRQVWIWGGYWTTPDAMHDEVGCTPQDLATGINWATVARKAGSAPPPYHPPAPEPPSSPIFPGVPEMFLAIDNVGLFAVIDGIPIPFPDLAAMGDAKRRSDGIPMMWLPRSQGEQMLAEMLKKHKAALT